MKTISIFDSFTDKDYEVYARVDFESRFIGRLLCAGVDNKTIRTMLSAYYGNIKWTNKKVYNIINNFTEKK